MTIRVSLTVALLASAFLLPGAAAADDYKL